MVNPELGTMVSEHMGPEANHRLPVAIRMFPRAASHHPSNKHRRSLLLGSVVKVESEFVK